MTEPNSHDTKKGQKRKAPERESPVLAQDSDYAMEEIFRLDRENYEKRKEEKGGEEEDVDDEKTVKQGGGDDDDDDRTQPVDDGSAPDRAEPDLDSWMEKEFKQAQPPARDLSNETESKGSGAGAGYLPPALRPGPPSADELKSVLERRCSRFAYAHGSIIDPSKPAGCVMSPFKLPPFTDFNLGCFLVDDLLIATMYLFAYRAHAKGLSLTDLGNDFESVVANHELDLLFYECFRMVFGKIAKVTEDSKGGDAEVRREFLKAVRTDVMESAYRLPVLIPAPHHMTPLALLEAYMRIRGGVSADAERLKECLLGPDLGPSPAKRARAILSAE